MANRTPSYKNTDPEKREVSYDTESIRPKPTDFNVFVPWACQQYGVTANVVVTRAVQAAYISAITTGKKRGKRKISATHHPSLDTQEQASNAEFTIYDIDALAGTFNENEKIVKIETVYDSDENLVQLKFLKNKFIPREVMQVVGLAIPYQRNLSSIIINKGFHMNALYEMSKFLPISLITEVCLDGTFLSEANYHILLVNSKLKHISLARCTINDKVVKLIAEQLTNPCGAAKILSALNLSTNRITDIGAKYLADALRTNRQLSYLNLSGNMITDEGGVSIFNILQRFPLQSNELIESRARYVDYLKEKIELVNMFAIELRTATSGKNLKKKAVKKAAKVESQNWQLHNDITDAQILQERAESLAESKIGLFDEPFSPDKTETRDGVVHCLGNNTLCYLNLAYNNLTFISIKKLLDVLTTQKALNRTPRGLIKVQIDGNLAPVASEEFEQINALLAFGISSNRKQSDSYITKKPASARYTAK